MRRAIALILFFLSPVLVFAQQPSNVGKVVPFPKPSATIKCLEIPLWMLTKYPNPDGSCVWLSMGVGGIHSNDRKCASVPFRSEYGEATRLGANPPRVQHVCAQRGIRVYNVTGKYSVPMARWAVQTGRGCAIGFDQEHFQAVWGYDYSRQVWFIWDNRFPDRLKEYTEAEFIQMHDMSGRWVVVNELPGSRIPHPVEW